jgi:type II secretory ATPase GspE/PulE/Tfp pilus assembly ATPase PilB-like protein
MITGIAALFRKRESAEPTLESPPARRVGRELRFVRPDVAPFRRFVDGILLAAISRGASEIEIEPLDGEVRVRYTIDGERVPACASLPQGAAANLATIVKEYARLDVSDREHVQGGRVRLRAETCPGKVHDVRMQIDVSPTRFGESTTIRLQDVASRGSRTGRGPHVEDRPGAGVTSEISRNDFDRALRLLGALEGDRPRERSRPQFEPRPPGAQRVGWAM